MPEFAPSIKSISEARGFAPQRWALLIVAVGYWGSTLRGADEPYTGGLLSLLDAVFQNGAYCVAAWAVLAEIVWRGCRVPLGRRSHTGLAVMACLIAAVPVSQAVMLAMLMLAIYFARFPGSGSAAALLLTGLAAEMIWISPYLLPLHAFVGRIDAAIVRALVGCGGSGNLVMSCNEKFDIQVLPPCASSFQLAAVALAYGVTRLFDKHMPGRRDLPWLLLSWAASIAITELRLAVMTRSLETYTWAHNGSGVTLYTLLAASSAFLIPAFAGNMLRQPKGQPA